MIEEAVRTRDERADSGGRVLQRTKAQRPQ